jgi:SAM-dependent methyltransferase
VFAPFAVSLALIAVFMPAREALWRRLHGAIGPESLVDEDSTGVAAIIPRGGNKWNVLLGGKRLSWLPFGRLHSHLGALPAIIHPAPTDVAIIGLGSGDSAWAAGCRPETRRVTVFELSAKQLGMLHLLATRAPVPQLSRLRNFLQDPRVHVEVRDGRNALFTDDRRYDVVEADALLPTAGYSGNLYSEEFFALCARKLKPGGIVCTWAPTPRVAAGFTRVFPHVLAVEEGRVLFGSKERIPMAREAWRQRLTSGPIVDYLGGRLAREVLEQLRSARRYEPATGETNEDLFPRDEFATPRLADPQGLGSPVSGLRPPAG